MPAHIKQPLNTRILCCVLALASAAFVVAAWAQERLASGQFMDRMNATMAEMDRSMKAAPMNGDVDHDFATMMIPHHDGAIEMAKDELLYGKDPTMRRMAQEILVDQQSEIDAMNLWLSRQASATTHKDIAK
jgi:uncharacterized protein (DUF305 family)